MTLVEFALIGNAVLIAAIAILGVVASKTETKTDDQALSVLKRVQNAFKARKHK